MICTSGGYYFLVYLKRKLPKTKMHSVCLSELYQMTTFLNLTVIEVPR